MTRLLFLRVVWISAVLWLELGVFRLALSRCRWPEKREPDSRIVRMLVMADPQLVDRHSYPDRGPILSTLGQYIIDLNLRKTWRSALHRLQPHAIVVLGDMMDSGRLSMSTAEYEAYYMRYKNVFNTRDSSLPVYYLPGNHDVGLGNVPPFSLEAGARYTSHFGPRNYRRTIGNHTLVFIDAPALVEEDLLRIKRGDTFDNWSAVPRGPIEFVKQTILAGSPGPLVLFTHIPLSRPADAPCGPLRERGTIRQGYGLGYQNTLSEGATEFLLNSLKPSLIMSGDDHDYCEYEHTIPSSYEKVQEVTVKSISIAMGIRRPGFQLLSLTSITPSPDHITQTPVPPPLHTPCLMPDQLGIYFYAYIPLALLTLLVLLVSNMNQGTGNHPWSRKHSRQDTPEALHELSLANSSHATDTDSFLQPPVTKSREHARRRSSWMWTFKLGGHRRRLTLPNPFASWHSKADHRMPRRDVRVLIGLLRDVGAVAWPPLFVFWAISLWVMQW